MPRFIYIPVEIRAICYQKNGSEPARGAVVALYDAEGFLEKRTADFLGRCFFRRLPPGVYRVKQISAPPHLIKSRTVHTVDLRGDHEHNRDPSEHNRTLNARRPERSDRVVEIGFANTFRSRVNELKARANRY